ncbi:hypothetical protein EDC01DRAFT_281639 [Geopyxis carbonaria]|nr:hypothetical protein EDC01DRAFT_281639 [Geopyxis carbonaria]
MTSFYFVWCVCFVLASSCFFFRGKISKFHGSSRVFKWEKGFLPLRFGFFFALLDCRFMTFFPVSLAGTGCMLP